MSFTDQQEIAITAPGSTVVIAGAGAGKTRTLVERCIRLATREHQPVSIRQLLVVTFTEAAAAEVRERIRQALEEECARRPHDQELQKQVALLDSAHIGTLHGFCYSLVREHFHDLGLDPAASVLAQEQAAVIQANVLEDLLNEHYSGAHPHSGLVQNLIQERFEGNDKQLRELILKIHEFTQTRPNPAAWFKRQLELLELDQPLHWREWRDAALRDWCVNWIPSLEQLPEENENAHRCAAILRDALENGLVSAPSAILERQDKWPTGKKGKHRPGFKELFTEAAFLGSITPKEGHDPLNEDWGWVKEPMRALLLAAEQFTEAYARAKRERSGLDFHDLEQLALELLWDHEAGRPTGIARSWSARFEGVFVDEYQDINAAQDLILQALSREANPGNRFLVGDLKQSIYRFRQADPRILQKYLRESSARGWSEAYLSDNFRSHEGILEFVNGLFRRIMREEAGGLAYDDRAALRFGNREARLSLSLAEDRTPAVEIHLVSHDAAVENEDEEDAAEDLEGTEREARLIAARLLELKNNHEIDDDRLGQKRRLNWNDMVVLLRGVKNRAEIFARVFHEFGVPLEAKRNEFYNAPEVMDLVSLLQILDNPLQGIPLAAVLRSPLAGLGVNDLARVRLAARRAPFWTALTRFHEAKDRTDTWRKVDAFLEKYHRWRKASRSLSLCHRLEMILTDTGYADWLLARERGAQRHANVRRFLRIAREFDEARGENLYLFLRHIEQLLDTVGDIEPARQSEAEAVRLMSVHQSKGLEFPVVAIAGISTKFNYQDSRGSILLDEELGICPQVQPPDIGRRYASLPHWLASRRQRQETLAEEMRILYVALTRARHRLLLVGTVRTKEVSKWSEAAATLPAPQELLKAQNWLDWLGPHLAAENPEALNSNRGVAEHWSYAFHASVPCPPAPIPAAIPPPGDPGANGAEPEFRRRMLWSYPHEPATRLAAKTTATILRKETEADEEQPPIIRLPSEGGGLQRGTAHHSFLEQMEIGPARDDQALRAEAEALVAAGRLKEDFLDLIDFDAISAFWKSPLGLELASLREFIQRELPFTLRLEGQTARDAGLAQSIAIPEGEFVIVQGIADLVVIRPGEIWLVDFKTTQARPADLPRLVEEYRPQINIYSAALEAIYDRPVTRRYLHFLGAKRTCSIKRP